MRLLIESDVRYVCY